MSWATAKAITSLQISKKVTDEFPISCPACNSHEKIDKRDPVKIGRDIIIVLIVIVVAVVILAIVGVYTWLTASSLIMIAIISLAAYDKITDNTLGKALKLFFNSVR